MYTLYLSYVHSLPIFETLYLSYLGTLWPEGARKWEMSEKHYNNMHGHAYNHTQF